jgi:hypothetical protein
MENTRELRDLCRQYFARKYEYNEPETPIRGKSGQKWKFDAVISFNDQKFGVFIRDWNRSIGVNQIRQLEKACRDTKCAGGIIVGENFSAHAENFGENLGIQVIDRCTLMNKMRGTL